jgi:crossover junction endodeoxyribonuclease RusA
VSGERYILELPKLDPLNANDRGNWQSRAEAVKTWRNAGYVATRTARLPRLDRVRVALHAVPPTARRRDPSNLMPTQKAVLDGMVAAGLVPDDSEKYVQELVPVLHAPTDSYQDRVMKRWVWWVVVDELVDEPAVRLGAP